MTKQGTILKFSGHSDDIICVERIDFNGGHGKVEQDEITAEVDKPTQIRVQTIGGARGCFVFAHYDGCWHFSVRQVAESTLLPNNWTFEIDQMEGHDYSTQLTIDAYKRAGDLLDKPERMGLG